MSRTTLEPWTAIRAERLRLGVSLQKLADAAGIASHNLSVIERKRWPEPETLIAIARALTQFATAQGRPPVRIADLIAPLEERVA